AGDAVNAVFQENRVIVHRRQAASHGQVFAARQRYIENVVAPPTGWYCAPARDAERHIQPHTYSAMK
ncbi:hypothetical protein V2I80_26245, partial [Pseudomonas viridiflava]|nr:hypothetical protein [Pseudomonas viridiflava]MEE3976023.1 hypothetical protein [Pseudomonas viridiflava]MEE4021140.1 hypothetical protein [Pseudomonas viridiflava]MEE4048960.1 hypothetical protein [Pseudomonas viridiflava]